MSSGQQRLWHQFEPTVDLTYKAKKFFTYFDELEELASQLHQIVNAETNNSKGEIIDKIDKAILEQTEYNQLYCDASKKSMIGMADRYTDLVNEMSTQEVTLFYEIIEMGKG